MKTFLAYCFLIGAFVVWIAGMLMFTGCVTLRESRYRVTKAKMEAYRQAEQKAYECYRERKDERNVMVIWLCLDSALQNQRFLISTEYLK